VLRDGSGNGIPNVDAADIAILFNGGTAAQGFSGAGADSVIANSLYNQSPLCPDVRTITADAPTDANGVTYITFTGSTPGSPGVGTRNPFRKWGHFDSELSVYVLGTKLQGRLTSASANGSYVLRIKNFDFTHTLGLTTGMDEGEWVDGGDFNYVANHTAGQAGLLNYWADFDSDGSVGPSDFNMILGHNQHRCDAPNDD
jgi:hypothetical protein